ncbi:MAG: N-acetylglucosamine-6-phosphate deacetylase [Clostridia bacterium]|nr:N-acetylglucosamine-6-phosphate deacetylase [Clostridia bacterium]
MLQIKNGLIPGQGGLIPGDLYAENGKIVPNPGREGDEIIDAAGLCVLPGMIDIHMHGADRVDVNAADQAGYDRISRFLARNGTTGFLCSILTDTQEQTAWCLRQARQAMDRTLPGAQLLGIHLEGPFLSAQYKGAMPEYLLRAGDAALFRRYQEIAGGGIRYMTVSPEVAGVPELIQALRDDVVIAIGHSGCTYDQAMTAIRLGAKSCTHTFNAMRLFHQHEPAIMGAALESDVYCEAICDGRHLHPGSVRLLLKCKGWDRVVAITDSIMAAGLPDGQYKLGVNDVTVKDGDACLTENGVRAGSTLNQQQALKNLMAFTGQPLHRVMPLLTENPADLLDFGGKGRLLPGKDADLILTTPDGTVIRTLVGGRTMYQQKLS